MIQASNSVVTELVEFSDDCDLNHTLTFLDKNTVAALDSRCQ